MVNPPPVTVSTKSTSAPERYRMLIDAISGQNLFEIAEPRWLAIAAARPDLTPALDLQRRLLRIVVDVANALDAGRLPRLSLPPRYVAAKLARGVPLIAGEPIPL